MTQTEAVAAVAHAYFDLLYAPEDHRFEDVFLASAVIKGLRDGVLEMYSAAEYRRLMLSRPSPSSTNASRDEGIQNLINVGPELAAVTVRVKIGDKRFVDHMIVQCFDGDWRISAKAFHVVA